MKTTKKLLTLILAMITVFGCFSVTGLARNYDAKNDKSSYVVSKMTEKNSYGETTTTTYTYNSKGKKTKETAKNDSSVITTNYTYDSKGNLTKVVNDAPDSGYTITYTYDSKGNVTKKNMKDAYSFDNTTYTYDDNGNLKKSVQKSPGGYTETRTYTYDTKGNKTKEVFKSSDDFVRTITYTYDSKGNMTGLHNKTKDTDLSCLFTYNSKGYKTKEIDKTGKDTIATTVFSYDSKGNLTKQLSTPLGNAYYNESDFTYDSKGNLTKAVRKYAGKTTLTITCTYNAAGNKTSETYKRPDETIKVTYAYKKISADIVKTFDEKNVRLGYVTTVANGKSQKPSVSIDGMLKGAEYKVSYSNTVNPGKGKIKITFVNNEDPIVIYYDIKPAAASGLKTSSTTKTSTKLSWNSVKGATSYIIYKYNSSTKTYTKTGTTENTYFTVKNLRSATTYKFAVKACTKTTNGTVYSLYSPLVSVKTK